tara:strand:+ start:942 stop:1235 length:294 start_codon:yes stop_codon:yes gene_type:complete
MENVVTITLLALTLFGKIEMHTFEIADTRWQYHGDGLMTRLESNATVCSSWYHENVIVNIKKNPWYKPNTGRNYYTLGKYKNIKNIIGYICGGHEPQ